jgi:hypothetical protein
MVMHAAAPERRQRRGIDIDDEETALAPCWGRI